MKKLLAILTSGILLSTFAQAAPGLFTFSGGNGTPLTITITTPLQFTVDADTSTGGALIYVDQTAFSSPVSFESGAFHLDTTTITLSDSARGTESLWSLQWIVSGSEFMLGVVPYDSSWETLPAGDVVTLSAGTAVSWTNMSAPTPDSSATLEVRNNGNYVIGSIDAVPEPSSLVLLGAGVAGLALFRRKVARK